MNSSDLPSDGDAPVPATPIVLIVDDAPTNVRILADALRDKYRIKVASNGREALATALREPQPDLILLDVMMPELDGYEVCRRLKADDATRRIPVIFVTARNAEADEELGLDLGAADYISKPYSIPIVRARVRNLLAMKAQADLLERLSLIDPLTHVPNRRHLDHALDREWKRAMRDGSPLSLLMIDIDHFKDYNDQHGHGAGDDCLRAVAEALSLTAARGGDLVARYGGEEFVALLPSTDGPAAFQLAERLRARVEQLHLSHGRPDTPQRVTISIGCAVAKDFGPDKGPTDLLAAADRQLYRAKSEGRNRVCA